MKLIPMNEIYISVDIESSGPIPGEFSMLSIGACVVGNSRNNFYAELKPLNDNFNPKALEVNKLSMEKLKINGELPAASMARFETWIKETVGENRAVFVGFNATFDWSFTHWYFMKFLGRDPFGISGLDIKAYFMGMQSVKWRETTKKHVKKIFPSTQKHTHNALEDAIEQAEIFEKMFSVSTKYNFAEEEKILLNDKKYLADIKKARADVKAGRVVDFEDLKKEMHLTKDDVIDVLKIQHRRDIYRKK